MDYRIILSMMAQAVPGILSNIKAEKARLQGEAYLKEKYHLASEKVNVGFTMRLMEAAYPIEWKKNLFHLLKTVLFARGVSLKVSEACADVYIMTTVLRGGHRLDPGGGYGLGHYRYVKSLIDSKTYESIQDLARGRGSDVALQIVQKELRQWCAKEGIDPEAAPDLQVPPAC